ncbi:unnamed protein product [Urochloa humidicola]
MDLGIPSLQTVDRAPHGRDGRSPKNLRPKEKAVAAPVVLRLFGVDVRRVADEDGKGYASDDLELASRQQKRRRRKAQERKKGIPWTEEEYRKFLDGLRQLGKGDWRDGRSPENLHRWYVLGYVLLQWLY